MTCWAPQFRVPHIPFILGNIWDIMNPLSSWNPCRMIAIYTMWYALIEMTRWAPQFRVPHTIYTRLYLRYKEPSSICLLGNLTSPLFRIPVNAPMLPWEQDIFFYTFFLKTIFLSSDFILTENNFFFWKKNVSKKKYIAPIGAAKKMSHAKKSSWKMTQKIFFPYFTNKSREIIHPLSWNLVRKKN